MNDPDCKPVESVADSSKWIAAIAARYKTSLDIRSLNALALRSLVSLYNGNENLFHRCIAETRDGVCRQATSPRQTLIALLGLHRFAESGDQQPFDLLALRETILANTNWVTGVGDLGLLTWFVADCAPERLPKLFQEFDFGRALEKYPDGKQARTGALACFLAGISHARLAGAEVFTELTDIAVDAYHALVDNQGESGVFSQAALSGLLQRAFCRRFGTFEDQVYAIYALSTFARAFQVEEPLASALSCANSMRALQGERGEWWFLYDKQAGCVANRYPVLSRNQDGTAPCALLALAETTGQDFSEPIMKGLAWVMGANALGDDLRSFERGLIWDSIRHEKPATSYWEVARSLLHKFPNGRDRLRIHQEARPDHFGWLLYAFGRIGLPKPALSASANALR